jgi:malonate transporter and related proteins
MHMILLALVPIFFVLILGYTAGKRRVVNSAHVAELNAVVMNYALPASLLVATATTPKAAMLAQWPVAVVLGGAMMLVYPLSYFYHRRVRRLAMGDAAVQALSVALPNYAAAGLPVVAALSGPTQMVPVAVAIATGALLPSPLTLALLEMNANRGDSGRSGFMQFLHSLSHAVRRPIVMAPFFGTLWSLLEWPVPPTIAAALRLIGQATGGLALFVTGLILSSKRFRLSGNVALGVATSNVVQPLLALAIVRVFVLPWDTAKIAVLMAALPSGFFGILFGASHGVISEEANSTVIASTVCAMLTLALAIAWIYG